MSKRHHKPQIKSSPLHRVNNTLVDIVFAVHRNFEMFDACLVSIPEAAEGITYNIIAVDNGSPKEEADPFYARWGDRLVVIRNKENEGFPRACNTGARRKQSPLIFFLNTDVVLQPASLANLVKAMDDPQTGIVGMKLLFPPDSVDAVRPAGKVQHVGMAANIRGEFEHIFLGWSPDNPKVAKVDFVPSVTGAALMVRRSLFSRVHGFSEGYGRGTYEDVDLCLAVASLGYRVRVVQDAVGYHFVGATSSKYNLPMPMVINRAVFLARWGGKFGWSSYDYL